MTTPESRAESIFKTVWKGQFQPTNTWQKCCLERIDYLIRQAINEAIIEDRKLWDSQHEMDLKLTIAAQIEKDIKIITDRHGCALDDIINAIRDQGERGNE